MASQRRPFLIDTDTASDDAVALVMALKHAEVRVDAITVVAGNVPLKQGLVNALYTVELCGATTPVFAGADRPMLRKAVDATWFHGSDGMGGQHYPRPKLKPRKQHAVDVIIDWARATADGTLVTLGPLTNIALAIQRDRSIVRRIRRCVVMGGAACTEGNVTPAAEYNIWCDPEAAQIVFTSGLNITMVGWELSRGDANLDRHDVAKLRRMDTPLSHFLVDCNRRSVAANDEQSGEIGIPLPDPVAMAVAIEPKICTRQSRHLVQIETQSELTRGMTVVDRLGVGNDPRNRNTWRTLARTSKPVAVCWQIDVKGWKRMLFDLVAR